MTPEQVQHRAILSLLDTVEELAQGLAHGQKPTPEWAEVVTDTFNDHRSELTDPDSVLA